MVLVEEGGSIGGKSISLPLSLAGVRRDTAVALVEEGGSVGGKSAEGICAGAARGGRGSGGGKHAEGKEQRRLTEEGS